MVRSQENEEFKNVNNTVYYVIFLHLRNSCFFGRKARWNVWRPQFLERVWRYEELRVFQVNQCCF